jgi:hypothetical protein
MKRSSCVRWLAMFSGVLLVVFFTIMRAFFDQLGVPQIVKDVVPDSGSWRQVIAKAEANTWVFTSTNEVKFVFAGGVVKVPEEAKIEHLGRILTGTVELFAIDTYTVTSKSVTWTPMSNIWKGSGDGKGDGKGDNEYNGKGSP